MNAPQTKPIRIAVQGAAGRMGQRIVALATADPQFNVVAGLEDGAHPRIGDDIGEIAGCGKLGVPLDASLSVEADAVIDFSTPAGALAAVRNCVEQKIGLVMATTGLDESGHQEVLAAARHIPLLWAPNMSLAVNLLMRLTQVAAAALKDHASGADVEIIERHHRFKEDAPSGTALRFGEIVAEQMGQTQMTHGREGRPGVRPRDEIGFHALRTGDNPGEHQIVFGLLGETIELSVRATSRDCYAQGALEAARFVVGKPPGMYEINDVLGL